MTEDLVRVLVPEDDNTEPWDYLHIAVNDVIGMDLVLRECERVKASDAPHGLRPLDASSARHRAVGTSSGDDLVLGRFRIPVITSSDPTVGGEPSPLEHFLDTDVEVIGTLVLVDHEGNRNWGDPPDAAGFVPMEVERIQLGSSEGPWIDVPRLDGEFGHRQYLVDCRPARQ